MPDDCNEYGPGVLVIAEARQLVDEREADGPARRAVAVAGGWHQRLVDWAAGRTVSPSSLTGISLLFAVCAAAWFSAGTTRDVLPGLLAVAGWGLARGSARQLADRAASGAPGWPFAAATTAGECALYGGIAAGGQAAGWPGMWPLAVATVIAVAAADAARACSGAALWLPRGPRWVRFATASSAGSRVLVAAIALAVHGPRVALVAVLATAVAAVGYLLARLARLWRGDIGPQPAVARCCRDDGAVARWAGRLVQGKLPPLPAAVAAFVATAVLAALGLRNAAGIMVLAPVVVMMLAAPGAGHPHAGRLDWLAPVVMALAQQVYLAALGFASAVPGAAVFALCAVTAMWYGALAAGLAEHGGIGWEARLLLAGLAALLGFATFGYVGLAAYLAVLIGRRVLAGYPTAVEDAS